MSRFHLIRNLKTAVLVALFALVPVVLGGLYWANKTGLPDEWREALEQEISKYGAHVEIGSLTYIPLRGFVAKNLRVYAEEERINEISRFQRVQLVLDNASLATGQFKLKKIDLNNANLSLPVDPKNPAGESLDFTGVSGTIFQSGERLIEIRDARGQVGGIDVTLTARLLRKDKKKGNDEKNEGRRREMIANIISEIQHWNFDADHRPKIHVDLDGDLTDKTSLRANFVVEAASIEKLQYRLRDFKAKGELSGHLLTIEDFRAFDARGEISGHADYQLLTKEGRFDLESSIDIPRLLKSWLATPMDIDLLVAGRQRIRAAGDFNLTDLAAPVIHVTGHAIFDSIMFRGVSFDSLETWFSWQEGNLFLKDLEISRPDGGARGKVLVEKNLVRLTLDSTIPAPIFKPFFTGLPLEKVIADFSENENPSTEIHLDGSFDTKDKLIWAYSGHGTIKNLSYRGVPIKSATCSFLLDHHALDFFDGKVVFDYSSYPLRNEFDGPSSGTAKVGRIRYDGESKTVGVENVTGKFWAAPMLRCFAPRIADNIEQYRFHTPPTLSGSGVVDVTPQGRTDLNVKFDSPGKVDYEFLGENITLSEPQATVTVKGDTVRVSKLSAIAFGGPIAGSFVNSGKSELSGDLNWSKLSLAGLSSTYGFDMKGEGEVTGRIDFSISGGDIRTMSAEGLLGLENAELFSVPIFGPLSPVMSKVLNDKRAGFERAKAAFCTFNIRQGILRTRDFQTATSSITFAGDGAVDMGEKTVDFTIRLNARGLLGLITLPLRPFYGLFQFRGSGPLKDTVWENVHFTSPPEAQNKILLAPPPKALVVPE